MEHHTSNNSSSSVPKTPQENKNVRTPFVTPCRRMGLSRKSPSSGSWHASKNSPGAVSPYKSPINVVRERSLDNLRSENGSIENHVTPTRKAKTFPKRQLTKRLKTSHSISEENCEELKTGTVMIPIKQPDHEQVIFPGLNSSTNESRPHSETDTQTELMLPEGMITKEMIQEVRERIKKKEEILKDLNLAHLYKKKHDVGTLQKLTQTWLEGCQAALMELQQILLSRGHQLSMGQLLGQLNIPHDLVKYREDLEDFE